MWPLSEVHARRGGARVEGRIDVRLSDLEGERSFGAFVLVSYFWVANDSLCVVAEACLFLITLT